ncbi:MAG: CofH family radical SAM protein [Parachlamydiales bacterium]|nr:CofH family radical SAM protein [Parachlamydiales bacterium]
MTQTLSHPVMPTTELQIIADKVIAGQRLSFEDGCHLFATPHEDAVGELANFARKRLVGDTVYFATTLYIHPTNLCELSCPMCSFYAKPGMKKAWFMTPEQIETKVRSHIHQNLTEIHIVGGLWRECNLPYYQEMFTRIKAIDPKLHIKALTPVEYDFLARLHGLTIEEVFKLMISWGLGSLPGGGAEVLVERIRKQVAPQKISSDEYLNIHKIAHQVGLPSNITMLFGHVEDDEDLVTHLCKVRELQDETKGFQTFIPLKYHVENNALGKRKQRLKSKNDKKVFAVSRLMLDNVRNVKVLWNYLGIDVAKELLFFGANDLSSTNIEEQIIIAAGGIQVAMTKERLCQIILECGRTPKEIHSGHCYAEDQKLFNCSLTTS